MTLLFSIGCAFTLALLFGRVMSRLRLPRATAYLLVGIVAGRPLMNAFSVEPLIEEGLVLQTLVDFTLGLIVFSIGRRFRMARLRRNLGRLLLAAGADVLVTFILVLVATLVFGARLDSAMFLAVISIATAPAATMLVIREYESEGPVTDVSLLLVGINNLVSIVGFILVLAIAIPAAHAAGRPSLLPSLGLPLATGVGLGLVASVWDARIDRPVDRQMLAIGLVASLTGLAEWWSFNPLFACLIAAIVVANSSPRESALFDALEAIDYPLYVIFFVLAGTRLHREALAHLGLVGVAYIVARALGKILGPSLGVRLSHLGGSGRRWVGLALTAQAGVAIGLSRNLARVWPEIGVPVEITVLAAVVVFELLGPPAVRTALVRSGEVKLMTLLVRRAPLGLFESAHQVVNHFRQALGVPSWRKLESPSEIPVSQLMRKNVETVSANAMFDEVLRHLAATRYDRLLVLTEDGKLAGIINYNDVRSVIFDERLAKIVSASDLASPPPVTLTPDATIADAVAVLEDHKDMSFLPVVDGADPSILLGVVSQNDVLSAFRKLR